MKKITRLEKIKEVAETFIYCDIKPTDIGFIVSHPYTDSPYLGYPDGSIIDITKIENHERFIEICKERIKRIKKYSDFSVLITKPYRSAFFKYTNHLASDEDAAQFLKTLWLSTETVNVDANITRNQYVNYFKKYKPEELMNKEELLIFNNLEDNVTVYRGVNRTTGHPIKGLSWTPDISVARFFANRFSEEGIIYQAVIKKEDVLAYFKYENEIVVDYRKLKQIEVFEKS
jgi:hypothetical protein